MVVDYCRGRDLVPLDIILSLLWVIGVLAFLVLVGYLLQGRRGDLFLGGPYCLKYRPLPNYLESFHRRQQKRQLRFKRKSYHN